MLRLLVAIALVACSRERVPAQSEQSEQIDQIDVALERGGAFLATRQAPDGALRSRTYSALRDGWSLTPLAALALRFVPQQAAAYRRAVDFIAMLAPGGKPRMAPEVSYPLHAYAIGALVLGAPDNRHHRATQEALIARLRAMQLATDKPETSGGWGYSPDPSRVDPVSGEAPTANLSATVLAIGALVLGGVPVDDPALISARRFVEHHHNASTDGGFVFSRSEPAANKAGADERQGLRGYGSMTADGLRALLRLARPFDDPHVRAAIAYLDRNFDAKRNPGTFSPGDEVRRESSYYYWLWTAAHAARHLQRRAWAEAIATELLARQHADGSWRNGATEMREDDPIVATSFALAALALARSVLVPETPSHAYR